MSPRRTLQIRTPLLALVAVAFIALAGGEAFAADAAAPAAKPFKKEELASLLAPIALYPDQVVAQILMASTYPLEIVEANRWVQNNKNLKGEALAAEAKKQGWDASVQSLCAVPDVLKMMDEKLDWTQKVGDAVLAQQKEVMDMIQELRAKAKAEGNLKSDEKMKVSTDTAPATGTESTTTTTTTEVIVIESTSPEVIYVPTYNPVTVYGYWGYPAYPPYYWPPPVGYPGSGFWWGVGVGISIGFWGGAWDNHCDWHGGDINIGEINIDRGDRTNISGGDRTNISGGDKARGGSKSGASATATDRSGGKSWSHNPDHRKGVSYRDSGTAQKYNRPTNASAGSRDAYRGRSGSGSTPTAGTRDLSGGGRTGTGASAGTRDLGSGGGATAGTRELGSTGTRELGRGTGGSASSSSRGTTSSSSRGSVSSSSRGSSSSAFGGMSSGSRSSSYSSRGGMSRGGGGGRGGRR